MFIRRVPLTRPYVLVLLLALSHGSCNSGQDVAPVSAPGTASTADDGSVPRPFGRVESAGGATSGAERAKPAAAAQADREVLYRPSGVSLVAPLPTAIWLHGFRANPDLGATGQALADGLGIAILGISATEALGSNQFRWSEDPERDAERVRDAIEKHSASLTIAGKPALFGFSQGGKMAVEIAARDPARYAGAWAIAPGGFSPPQFEARGNLDGLFFRCSIGEGDRRGKVAWTRSYCEQARAAGATTETDIEVGFNRHAFPPGFAQTFVRWASRALDLPATRRKRPAP